MTHTETNVIVTQYRAEFSGLPFAPNSGEWRIRGGMEYRTTLQRRRRWTVAAEFDQPTRRVMPASKAPVGSNGHVGIHPSNLIDSDAVVVFVPNSDGARFGTAVLVEQIVR
jgi:hypothetical protein